jgi:hypothetical protein
LSQSQYPSSFDYQALLASGRGELFGPGNPQLPAPPMLMFDRIARINADGGAHGKGYVEAELDIHPDLWFFQCHFIGDPVMPGCLGLDAGGAAIDPGGPVLGGDAERRRGPDLRAEAVLDVVRRRLHARVGVAQRGRDLILAGADG